MLFSITAQAELSAEYRKSLTEPRLITEATENKDCLECHDVEGMAGFAVSEFDSGSPVRERSLYIDGDTFMDSVHNETKCVGCHVDIKQMPHKKDVERSIDCVNCHEKKIERVAGTDNKVLTNIGHYLDSIHAQPNENNPEQINATCWQCHGKHDVFPMDDKEAKTYRLSTPETCGSCHEEAFKEYTQSVHGAKVKRHGDMDAAVCSDCHSAHTIASPEDDPVKIAITENCGDCHEEEYDSYRETYHGQVAKLGYTHTAKCFECHEFHKTQKVDNVNSKVHIDNRLETCRECHKDATAGFATFQPHGNSHDFEKYPQIWIVTKFMIALLVGVFAVFWLHSALWFYREYMDRKTGKAHIHVDHHGDPSDPNACQYVERFSWPWRVAHLALAIAVMVLTLTGTAVLYAGTFWAPLVMKMLGGPEIAAIIHRVAALTFAGVFFGHLVVIFYKVFYLDRKTFRWFGPTSLLPRWQDMYDVIAMVKWFFNKGPRPTFDRWTYFEKFDYWAPFWGMFIIGCSGLILWFPNFFAIFLPGWSFNVATIVHGEEAFLAAVFLFTVHFFNCHFRPDKFPQDTVMFTGRITMEEFREERPFEYERLVKDGTLDKYLVGAPSARMAKYSSILGGTLIIVGVILLFLVLQGFIFEVLL
ncbi:MAG: cytochrome C [Proteobacteria bacterium]|nr:cytochrome C [Pseudomonadota bacterium]